MTITLMIETAVAFAAVFAFSMLLNVPRRELLFCGLIGAAGWLLSGIVQLHGPAGVVLGTFVGTLMLTALSRIMSNARKTPVLAYLIGGILPLVPGSGIYYTMYALVISKDTREAMEMGILTAQITGVIAMAIICILALPRFFFDFKLMKRK